MAIPKFSPLKTGEHAWIQEQLEAARLMVDAFSPSDAGQPMTLAALDRAFAAWLARGSQDNVEVNGAINAVGIRFGQFLVDDAGFEWVIASDEHGTDLAILALPGRGDVLVYPANFVSKRWERKESNFLVAAVNAIKYDTAGVEADWNRQLPRPWWKFW